MLLWMFYTQPDLLICPCVSLFSVGCLSLFILFFGGGVSFWGVIGYWELRGADF